MRGSFFERHGTARCPSLTSGRRAFWERRGSARNWSLARCSACDRFIHPPETVCPHCGSDDATFEFIPVDGSGRIRSWTDGASIVPPWLRRVPSSWSTWSCRCKRTSALIGRLVDGPAAPLRLDLPVRMVFEDIAPGVAIPAFALEEQP